MTGNKVIKTAHYAPARIKLFLPSQRPRVRNGEWTETSWGRCRVFGRLGQRHADVLEAILFCAERRHDEGGGVKLLVDPAMVRTTLSDSRYSLSQIWLLIREIMSCVVEIDCSNIRMMGSIIERAEYTKAETRRNPLTQGERRLWTIQLGNVWSTLMSEDRCRAYDPGPIARLKHGISQGVCRFLLSHSTVKTPNAGWKFLTVIHAVAGDISGQGVRNARRRLRADFSLLAEMGIHLVSDERISVDRREVVPTTAAGCSRSDER